MNVNFGLFPPIVEPRTDEAGKRLRGPERGVARKRALSARAETDLADVDRHGRRDRRSRVDVPDVTTTVLERARINREIARAFGTPVSFPNVPRQRGAMRRARWRAVVDTRYRSRYGRPRETAGLTGLISRGGHLGSSSTVTSPVEPSGVRPNDASVIQQTETASVRGDYCSTESGLAQDAGQKAGARLDFRCRSDSRLSDDLVHCSGVARRRKHQANGRLQRWRFRHWRVAEICFLTALASPPASSPPSATRPPLRARRRRVTTVSKRQPLRRWAVPLQQRRQTAESSVLARMTRLNFMSFAGMRIAAGSNSRWTSSRLRCEAISLTINFLSRRPTMTGPFLVNHRAPRPGARRQTWREGRPRRYRMHARGRLCT